MELSLEVDAESWKGMRGFGGGGGSVLVFVEVVSAVFTTGDHHFCHHFIIVDSIFDAVLGPFYLFVVNFISGGAWFVYINGTRVVYLMDSRSLECLLNG